VSWPSVTIVFLAYNRRDKLRESLRRMLDDSDYERERVDVIVVDNASTDGTADMVRAEFPGVRLIAREQNVGVSGWNDGFAVAEGDWVLALDDDCYLPPDGLRRAISEARDRAADLVSFKVVSTYDPELVFTEAYRTGLFTFWGCAVLVRRPVVQELGGYDPEIFVWANELELILRFFDRGYRHLYLPEVVAQHMKPPLKELRSQVDHASYPINARHWAYIAAKLFRPRDACEALIALLARGLRDGVRLDRMALKAVPETVKGFLHGLRFREPLQNRRLSRFYRTNFESFASLWWFMRPPRELLRAYPREILRRQPPARSKRIDEYYRRRARYYPDRAATLDF
jgi:GT2 family glycosyltransferase